MPEGNGGCTFFPRQAPLKPSAERIALGHTTGKACMTHHVPWENVRDADEYECGLMVRPQKGHAVLWPNVISQAICRCV